MKAFVTTGHAGLDKLERDPNAVTTTSRKPGMFPLIQGCDVVGRIVEFGSGVSESRLGERVIVNFIEYDEHDPTVITGGIGSSRPGGYAEYVAVRSPNAHVIDSPLSDAELATFPCAYITAEHMLDAAGVKEGELARGKADSCRTSRSSLNS